MEKTYIMKLRIITVPVLAGIMALTAAGQNVNRLEKGQTPPDGVVIYSLPMTSIHLSVEAVCETYTPGPYSKWAKKYLGIDVPQEASTSYTLSNIRMTPYLEADRSCSYIVNLDGFLGEASPASFFEFSSQGLLLLSDESKGKGDSWRFPSIAPGTEVLSSEATANLTSTETTLYRTVRNESGGYDRVAVRQSQVVEKSPEKNQEAAAMILSLRENRINIITGNTDATFSGDALRAAVEEIGRLEEEYMSLFTGSTATSLQQMSFDVVPESGKSEELTVAFRLSDTQGLLPPDDVSGRPIVMEITPEDNEDVLYTDQIIAEVEPSKARARHEAALRGNIFYRIPGICTIRVIDGQNLILKSRMPVYQKGEDLTFPVHVLVK